MSLTDTVSIRKGHSSATVHLFGATLISWKPNKVEALFVSENSCFDKKKPIRGGVPFIFPQFGPWELGPQHGFARRLTWAVKDVSKDGDSVILFLQDSEETRKTWKYKFLIEYTLSLPSPEELKMDVVITNKDHHPFDFTFLLHTYFTVDNVKECTISGLKGCEFIDKTKGGSVNLEENDLVSVSSFTDRVYKATSNVNILNHTSGNRCVTIKKYNLPDTVVWNPWLENAKKMDDFSDDEYTRMLCVEAGHVSNPYTLLPDMSFLASQTLSVNC